MNDKPKCRRCGDQEYFTDDLDRECICPDCLKREGAECGAMHPSLTGFACCFKPRHNGLHMAFQFGGPGIWWGADLQRQNENPPADHDGGDVVDSISQRSVPIKANRPK